MTTPTLNELATALAVSWGADTAYAGRWSPECPELNQCAVTAMLVQDYFGGDLLRCPIQGGGWHYWNGFANGDEVDLTEKQFDFTGRRPLRELAQARPRRQLDRIESVVSRYVILKARVNAILQEQALDFAPPR